MSWISRSRSRRCGSAPRRQGPSGARSFRPRLEALEPRHLLSFAPTHGVYGLTPVNGALPQSVLDNPSVDGIAVRSTWDGIETADDVYDWGFFDSQIAAAAEAGKKVSLSVRAGVNTPQWVYDQGAQPFLSAGDTIPLPWDRTFLDEWAEFVADLGARYASDPTVDHVKVTGINFRTAETLLPNSAADLSNWVSAGYTRRRVSDAFQEITDTFSAAFPDKGIAPMLVPGGFPPLDDEGNPIPGVAADFQMRTRLIQYGIDHYAGQLIVQNNGLSTFFIPPWVVAVADQVTTGYQMLWFVTDDPTYRMNNGVPDEPSSILRRAIDRGVEGGARFLEIYPSDILNPDLQDLLADAHARLSAPLTTVESVVVNDGSLQRSRVTSITVTFTSIVTLQPGAFLLVSESGAAVSLDVNTSEVDGRTVAVLTFAGGPLPDGQYALVIRSDRIRDCLGNPLDGDGDGTPGGDWIDTFFRLDDDSDGDLDDPGVGLPARAPVRSARLR